MTRTTMLVVAVILIAGLAGCSGDTAEPADLPDPGTETATESTKVTNVAMTASGPPCKQSPSGQPTAPSTPACHGEPTTETAPNTASPTASAPTTITLTGTTTQTASTTTTVEPTANQTESATAEPTEPATEHPDIPIDGGTARSATITRVIDGDTVEVEFSNGDVDTIRLVGVDTPETIASNEDPSEYGIPDTVHGRDWLLNWGEKAKQFARDELIGTHVRVVTDPKLDTRGSYGRLLAYIYDDGVNFNRELLERGLARRYDDSQFTLREEFGTVEAEAHSKNRGLWAFEQSTPTPTVTSTPPPTPTATPSPTPTRTSTPTVTAIEPPSTTVADRDCGDFETHDKAQQFFESHNPDDDPHRLDGDGDGQACESLP
ncbi:thermonuclease family protein [Halocatena marina]|uniref:Thermonuclease family protein n=1 Tax=Halocatena marina TaxID=2934937 RepID=A0ABD5YYV5_9EURY